MEKIWHILLATWICATLCGCSLVTGSRIECDPEDDYCPSGYHCDQGECVPGGGDGDADGDGDGDTDGDTPRHCGDRTCDLVENAETCPEDCPASCGDMLCSHNESACSCPEDCSDFCGDECCTHDEDAAGCPSDCPPSCEDGLCTHLETALACPEDCPPDCGDEACTHDEANEESERFCRDDCPITCGDDVCDPDENAASCSNDCEAECGDGDCTHDENAENCEEDCPDTCGDDLCTRDETANSCRRDCPVLCGDGVCSSDVESACTCRDDCAAECGDGCCTHAETNAACPADCGAECGNGVCAGTETALSCSVDCPAVCGDGAVTHLEDCEGTSSVACPTSCGSTGTRTCITCVWTDCVPPDEVCNGRDDNCEGTTDEGSNGCGGACSLPNAPGTACDGPDTDLCSDDEYECAGLNDTACSAGTDNVETCATVGVDDDCDGTANERDAVDCISFNLDEDGDTYGTDDTQCWCSASDDYTASRAGDCNDGNAAINPGATETCATVGVDDDCDEDTNDLSATGCTIRYNDGDSDDYYPSDAASECRCTGVAPRTATLSGDCNDADAAINPGATELCNGEDDDCNDEVDEVEACVCDATTGGLLDPTSGLCWQEPVALWLSWENAVRYCDTLDLGGYGPGSWHLPTISELRSLIRGCAVTMTGGDCGVIDSCLDQDCWSIPCGDTSLSGCSSLGGSGMGGAYWPEGFSGSVLYYWSSSPDADDSSFAWFVAFNDGNINRADKGWTNYLRCVRVEP